MNGCPEALQNVQIASQIDGLWLQLAHQPSVGVAGSPIEVTSLLRASRWTIVLNG
jgi:hypothetical protein